MRVLVTGAAGFIGSHLTEECLRPVSPYGATKALGELAAGERAPEGSTYNLGGGSTISMLEALDIIRSELRGELQVHVDENQRGDARNTSADMSLARAELGFEPSWDVAGGLREQVAWHRAR